jgi:uncharacterized membrane protein
MLTWFNAHPGSKTFARFALVAAAAALLGAWAWLTPSGLLGKADAVGYAVCHRIAIRSFFIAERQFPLCARCSGMYLGALVGLLYQTRWQRKAGMPPWKILVVLGAFLLAFAIDGGNSYLHLFPGFSGLYQPTNFLRLLTGSGVGLGIAAVPMPVVHQTLWSMYNPAPALKTWRNLLEILLLAALVVAAMLSNNPLILIPLAVLSSGTILVVLTLVYTILWVMLIKRENSYSSWKQLPPVLLAGFTTALAQIAAMDAARYLLTGTWDGFHF